MATQIRNIVTREMNFLVGNNEDWIDGWPFIVAGPVAEDADPGNTGTGTVGVVTVSPSTPLGLYRIVITDIENGATFFTLFKRETTGDQDLARGVVGLPVEANGMVLTVLAGGPKAFVVGDGFSLSVLHTLQDVTGIQFALHLRRNLGVGTTYPATPAVFASTEAGTLFNGGVGGIVNANVSHATMRSVEPRTYDYDLLAIADGTKRRVYYGTVQVVEGVTRTAG